MTDLQQSNLAPHHRNPYHNHDRFQRYHPRSTTDVRIPAIERYAYCCFCIHVKPATIVIAIWKLIRSLQFAVLLLSAELSTQDHHSNGFRYHPALEDDHRSTNVAFCILLRVVIASASGVAIYAVCSGRAALLMPLYSMVLIDFFLGLPAFYNRDIDPTYADGLSDFRNDPIPPHNDRLIHTFFLISSLILISKIYFLCVIWQCFRYLRLKELVSPHMRHGGGGGGGPSSSRMYTQMPSSTHNSRSLSGLIDESHNSGGMRSSLAPPAYDSVTPSTKPPTYEDAIKSPSIFTIDIQQTPSSPPLPSTDPLNRLPEYTASAATQSSSINHIA